MSKAKDEKGVSAVRFKQMPPKPPQRYDWETIADKLRRKPGEWALIFENDRQTLYTAIRHGSITALRPSKGFEATTRNNTRGVPGEQPRRCDLWLRYNPDEDEES